MQRGYNPNSHIKVGKYIIQCRKCKDHFKKPEMHVVKTVGSPVYYLCDTCLKIYDENIYRIKNHIEIPRSKKGYIHAKVQCYKCKQVKPKNQLVNCGYTHPNEHKYKCKGECNGN